MSFENNFSHHSKEYIFFDNETLSNQREQVFKKIIQKNYDKKKERRKWSCCGGVMCFVFFLLFYNIQSCGVFLPTYYYY